MNSTTENSASGLESVAALFKYQFKNNSDYHFAISGEYRYRPYENEVYSSASNVPADEIVLGDSGASFLVTAHLDAVISKWTTIESSLGYHMPPNDLSPELPYRISLIKNFNTWAFWGGVKGIYSLGSDEYADAPSLKPFNANGETARWNSINRSFAMPFGGVRFLMGKKYRLSFEGGQIMSGTSTDKTMEGLVSLSWNTGGVSKEERLENAFKEYTSEATIIKVSPRGKFLKIDKGLVQDVAKGAAVDIYKSDYFGGNILIASGVVYESGPNWAIVRLTKRYKDMPIEKGLTVRVK
ncbi:hypothetical protein M900_A0349 [Bacteriovorax sp. Seq25_V]|nr:hypothetical protein M900_A0349 [Bacteriovorax sp. Seq25_V]